jgi:hypothetical protein
MMTIEFIMLVLVCICIGVIYAVLGYKVTDLFTDSPKWKPWEQMLFWLFWPIVIPLFLCLLALFVTAGLLIPILFVIGTIIRFIGKLFN